MKTTGIVRRIDNLGREKFLLVIQELESYMIGEDRNS